MKKLLVLVLVANIFFACTQASKDKSDTYYGVLIVAHKSDNSIHFINRLTGETLSIIETGIEPHEVEVSEDGSLVIVCNYGNREVVGNTLSVYDVQNATLLKTIDLGEHKRPHGMQWIVGSKKLLVTAESTNNLLVVDIEKGIIERIIATNQPVSHMVAANIDFAKAFVPSIRTGNVTVIDLMADTAIAQIYSGKGAEGVAVSPCGNEFWVTNRSDNTLTVFDTQSHELLNTLDCGDFPIRIKFSPDGSKVLVSNAQSADVAIFDALNKLLLAKVKLIVPVADEVDDVRFFAKDFRGSSIPIGLVVPHNNTAYVANTNADLVSEINLVKFEITRHFHTGKQPDGINFSPIMPKTN